MCCNNSHWPSAKDQKPYFANRHLSQQRTNCRSPPNYTLFFSLPCNNTTLFETLTHFAQFPTAFPNQTSGQKLSGFKRNYPYVDSKTHKYMKNTGQHVLCNYVILATLSLFIMLDFGRCYLIYIRNRGPGRSFS